MSRTLSDPAIPSVAGFWDFVAMRQEAYWLKKAGKPHPNQMMATNHWPNIFRELDKGTIYFQRQTQGWHHQAVLYGTVVYRLLNRQRTFEDLGGIPRAYELGNWAEKLTGYRETNPIFTSKHLTPSWGAYKKSLEFLERFGANLYDDVVHESTLKGAWSQLRQVPGTGGFLAWQMCCDLLESGVLKFSENEWVYVGPGPQNAFQLLLDVDTVTQAQCLHRLNWLRERQHKFLAQGSIHFQFPEAVSELTLKNLEHAMCEYYRWVAAHWKKES